MRHGRVRDEVAAVCRELRPAYLVLGRPKGHNKENVFTQSLLEDYARQIEKQTGASVVLSGNGDR